MMDYRDRQRLEALLSEPRRRRSSRWATGFAIAAVVAGVIAVLAAYRSHGLSRELDRLRSDAGAAELWRQACEDDKAEIRAEVRRQTERADAAEAALRALSMANTHDLARLAGIDEQLERARFATVESAIAHGLVHHGQLSTCNSSLLDCRDWLGYCDGGFWRNPEEVPR